VQNPIAKRTKSKGIQEMKRKRNPNENQRHQKTKNKTYPKTDTTKRKNESINNRLIRLEPCKGGKNRYYQQNLLRIRGLSLRMAEKKASMLVPL
jgi:hypothetical protein